MRKSTKLKDYTDWIHANLEVKYESIGGDEMRCLCPLHDDRDPSFSINRNTGLWFCQSCGIGGNRNRLAMYMRQRGKQRQDASAPLVCQKFGSAAT